jgi:hypothetical protein
MSSEGITFSGVRRGRGRTKPWQRSGRREYAILPEAPVTVTMREVEDILQLEGRKFGFGHTLLPVYTQY